MKNSLIILLLFLTITCFSQVQYVDIIPDKILNTGNFPTSTVYYYFNFTNDSIDDFYFSVGLNWGYSRWYLFPLNKNAFVYKSNYVDTLNLNYIIDSKCKWNETPDSNIHIDNQGTTCYGYWCNAKNKFIGLRIKQVNGYIYGWMRLLDSRTVADYAFNLTVDQPIKAGEGLPFIAEGLKISDISNFQDGRDLKIQFTRALDESKVKEYRIIVVKSSDASTFTIDSANLVSAGNYTTIIPTGADFSNSLDSTAKDKDGNTIIEFIPYKIFVLSIADGINATENALSLPSNEITLTSPTPQVKNVKAVSEYLYNGQYNITVTFDSLSDESVIAGYRLLFIQAKDSVKFNIDSANLVFPANYIEIIPSGHSYQLTYSHSSLHDVKGNLLEKVKTYKTVVMAVNNGSETNINTISKASNTFDVFTQAQAVPWLLAEDIADYHNANDIKIKFQKVVNETEIKGYRIFLVPGASSTSFNLDSANSVSPGRYTATNPLGSDQVIIFPSTAVDINGVSIKEEKTYNIFIMSVANGYYTDCNALSKASNPIAIHTQNYLKAGQKDGGVVYIDIPDTAVDAYPKGVQEEFYLDLNQDNKNDFRFFCTGNSSPSFYRLDSWVQPLNGSKIHFINSSSNWAAILDSGYIIYPSLYWKNSNAVFASSSYYMPNSYSHGGLWLKIYDKYLGVCIFSGNDTIYGWVQMSVTGYSNIIIKSYAWQKHINSIYSDNHCQKGIAIFPNPANNKINIIIQDAEETGQLSIYNIHGQKFYSEKIKGNNEGLKTIDVSGFPKGIYLFEMIYKEGIKTEKIVIE